MDGLPYVGLVSSDARHVYVITGLRKWGLTNGTAAALILTNAVSGRDNPWAAVFDSNRTTPAAEAGDLAEEETTSADVTSEAEPHPGKATLSPGEGMVIEVAGESTAGYKDTDGQVHSLSASCTHLGCTVEFNPADTTWDCPCHGSRFAADGTVIHGPDNTNLPPGAEHLPEGIK